MSDEFEIEQPHILNLPLKSSPGDLDLLLNRIPASNFRLATEIVFVCDEDLVSVLGTERARPAREAALERVAGKPVLTVTYDPSKAVHSVRRLTIEGLSSVSDSATAILRIKQFDLARMVNETSDFCYYRSTRSYHFLTPSLKHCSRFLRVGNMIRSVSVLDRLAFWILPQVAAADLLLVDSWSIVAVVLRALHKLRVEKSFDCLPSHLRQDKEGGQAVVEKLLSEAPPNPELICFVSVNSSGSILAGLDEILQPLKSRLGQVKIVCLYSFAHSSARAETLCRLTDAVENYESAQDCLMCKEGSRPVPIDASLYHVKSATEREVTLRDYHFREGRTFLEKYQHVENALRFHRSDPNDNRHHAFDVDVLTLLSDPTFENSYLECLDKLRNRPELVISPNHDAGKAMARIARERLCIPQIVDNDLRHVNRQSDFSLLQKCSRILIVGTQILRWLE